MAPYIIAIIGSGALSALIAGIFNLISSHREKADKRFRTLEKDVLRTQIILMLKFYPNEQTEILRLSQHYFSDLDGNWVMTSMFNSWLEQNKIAKPEWFKED